MRGATSDAAAANKILQHFYSHAPCGARLPYRTLSGHFLTISTHTPLAGRDMHAHDCGISTIVISTHTPLAGRDERAFINDRRGVRISTHTPLAGRDYLLFILSPFFKNFYSHAPCGARRLLFWRRRSGNDFYSHAPCGARHILFLKQGRLSKFLLTRPLRGATNDLW